MWMYRMYVRFQNLTLLLSLPFSLLPLGKREVSRIVMNVFPIAFVAHWICILEFL